MSAMEATVLSPVTYVTRCHSCDAKFDAMTASWCQCVAPLRTLRCPYCESCFCHTPMPFKRKFWAAAPLRLSHDPGRFFVQLNGTPAAADSAPSIPAHVHRPLVLVVDDDESMKSLVACYVEQLGYRTLTASDPLEALDVMAKRSVDVVITDALMPKMDGRELCRRIKSSPEGQSQKVIVMTSLYKSRAYEMEAIHRFGADALIKKPLDLKTLNALMEELAPIE